MRVLVIGCGIAGVTAAYFLRDRGAEVVVIDRAPAPARETSYANGSMITPSLADPWNAPGVLRQLIRSVGHEDSAMLLRLGALPSLLGWGIRFLRHSRERDFLESFMANVRLARYSQAVMADLLQSAPIEFQYAPDGTVKVFEDAAALQRGREVASWLRQAGIDHRVLDREGLLEMEPALTPTIERFTGAIHYPQDEVGNARHFCEGLMERAVEAGVSFRFSEMVLEVERKRRRIVSVRTARERIAADVFVLAAGSYSWPLGRQFGVRVPVRPAKGYSITVPTVTEGPRPRYAIVDEALHAAVVPLGGDRLRVAGTAEFAGFDATLTQNRIDNLRSLLGRIYPQLDVPRSAVEAWCGFRPMTADGRPLIGRSRVDNLYLNTGHGALGWTLGCGSGKALADLIVDGASDHDVSPFEARRR